MSFKIFTASAGSGKTFRLTVEYLSLILGGKFETPFKFSEILAITFTNKAVNELKSRIIDNLYNFSSSPKNDPMFDAVRDKTKLDKKTLSDRSILTLKTILNHYNLFNVITIDGFNHKLLRSFSFDLKIPESSTIALETQYYVEKAVDSFIDNIDNPSNKFLNYLIEFAIDKIKDNKTGNITRDLTKVANLMINDASFYYLKKIKSKKVTDFLDFKRILEDSQKEIYANIKDTVTAFFDLVDRNNIEWTDFTGRYLPRYMNKLKAGFLTTVTLDAAWQNNINNQPLYPKKNNDETKYLMDQLSSRIIGFFEDTKKNIHRYRFYKNIKKNIVPLSLVNEIFKTLEDIKEEDGVYLISEINTSISDLIRNHPTPYIYERLGERFKYFFIDEFQDTSELQWSNLIPLIGNVIEDSENQEEEDKSLFLVGDVKQAIYRFRGGKPELLSNLISKKSKPFQIEPSLITLDENYRSHRHIVEFNNLFFNTLGKLIDTPSHKEAYAPEYVTQTPQQEEDGFISLSFIEDMKDVELNGISYCEETLQIINDIARDKTHNLNDICILVRKSSHEKQLKKYLEQHDIKCITSDSLNINDEVEINFINDLLALSIYPDESEIRVRILNYFYQIGSIEDLHECHVEHLEDMTSRYLVHNYNFRIEVCRTLKLYDAVLYIINSFFRNEPLSPPVIVYMDIVYDFYLRNKGYIYDFLEYWEEKKDTFKPNVNNNLDAVKIMTIHKSKGLEFPIVIMPFADTNIYYEKEPKIWLKTDEKLKSYFDEVLIDKTKESRDYNNESYEKYHESRNNMLIDSINIIYVAMTRAKEELYIISKYKFSKNEVRYYSDFFRYFLEENNQWDADIETYTFGVSKRRKMDKEKDMASKTKNILT